MKMSFELLAPAVVASFPSRRTRLGRSLRSVALMYWLCLLYPSASEATSVLATNLHTRPKLQEHLLTLLLTRYCSVVRTGIGNTSLILAGEVDCVLGSKPSDPTLPIPWVELKTSATQMHQNPNSVRKWENKLLRIWAQSFLIGVPKVVVGFRSPTGDLESLQELDTQKIPGQVSRGQKSWDGNVCISMTASFLEWLKESLLGKDGVWRVKLARNAKQIELFQIEETGTGRVIEPGFKAHRERLLAAEIAQKLGSST